MRDRSLLTMTDLAREEGTTLPVISGLVKLFGLTPKDTGLPGTAKGLDVDDVRVIRAALAAGREAAAELLGASAA